VENIAGFCAIQTGKTAAIDPLAGGGPRPEDARALEAPYALCRKPLSPRQGVVAYLCAKISLVALADTHYARSKT